jgi:hypothetical protein
MQQLAVVVPQLLALLAKSSLLLVMSLLTELLVADKPLGQAILTSSGELLPVSHLDTLLWLCGSIVACSSMVRSCVDQLAVMP